MNTIKQSDIKKRINCLKEDGGKPINCPVNPSYLLKSLKESYSFEKAMSVITNWKSLNVNTNEAFTEMMEAFDLVCENDTISHINHAARFINESTIPKVRDGAQTQVFIKRKLGRLKTKLSTKINNKIQDAINAAIIPKSPITSSGASDKDGDGQKDQSNALHPSKEETVKECYDKFYETATICKQCDRVVSNYNKLSKRFNIDKVVIESVSVKEDIPNCIDEICGLIDTYNIPLANKYNVALENIMYSFSKLCITATPKEIVDEVTDYFIFHLTEDVDFADAKKDMSYVLSNNQFYTESDKEDVMDILENRIVNEESSDRIRSLNEFKKFTVNNSKPNPVGDLIKEFKSDDKKDEGKLKALINRIYSKDAQDIIDETPSLLNLFRMLVVGSTFAINPVLGAVNMFVDYMIRLHIDRKQTEKLLTKFKNEKKSNDEKIKSAKTDEEKKRLEAYSKELDKDIKKINDYFENLHTDEENANRDTDIDFSDNDMDIDFDNIDDFDFNIDESTMTDILKLKLVLENQLDDDPIRDINDRLVLEKVPIEIIDSITEFALHNPDLFDRKRLISEMNDELRSLRKLHDKSYKEYMRIDCLAENVRLLEHMTVKVQEEKSIDEIIYDAMALKEFNSNMKYVYEYCDVANVPLLEMNFVNTLKLAGEKLKKNAEKLSDKDKEVSSTIDASVNHLRDKSEKALKETNKEQLLRGDILPSASKCIKTAIIAGVGWAINPAIAVIGLLGAIGVAATTKNKERQLILDDIQIELQMCDKYIKIAEDNNDMKAMEQLLRTQRSLQRQEQRIRYKMNVVGNRNIQTPSDSDND